MNKKTKNNIAVEIVLWCIAACTLALCLSAICAYLIVGQVLPQNSTMTLSRLIAAISVFTTTILATHGRGREARWILALGVSAGYSLISLLCKLAFFPGESKHLLLNLALCFAAGVIATLFAGSRKKSRHVVAPKRRR